jgi:hypothetical protein
MGQVLYTMPTFAYTKTHKFWPILAGQGANHDIISIFSKDFNAFCIDMHDDTIEKIIPKEHIVASAENQILLMLEHIGANQGFKLLNLVDFNEMLCHGVEAEAVEWPEVDIIFHGCKDK